MAKTTQQHFINPYLSMSPTYHSASHVTVVPDLQAPTKTKTPLLNT